MAERDKGYSPSIYEAVEALSNIASMEIDRSFLMTKPEILISEGEAHTLPADTWLQEQDPETSVSAIREIFHVILSYLRNYYRTHYILSQRETEAIKAIMVLVGEAAKKLDKYTYLFQHSKIKSVTDLKEYQRLQDFYLTRIAKKIDEGLLSKWIMALSHQIFQKPEQAQLKALDSSLKHVFVDIEAVKRDADYELFFIRKDDGSRFFNPRLIRNIKLTCNFGGRITDQKRDDPLDSVPLWKDKAAMDAAQDILNYSASYISKFYHYVSKHTESELAYALSKALMALMLCSNSHNLRHADSIKNCQEYFIDFQTFLRQALHTIEYQKMLAYQEKDSSILIHLTHALCHAFFANVHWDDAISTQITNVIKEASEAVSSEHKKAWQQSKNLTDRLLCENAAITRLLKQHAYGHLVKVLDILENGDFNSFDPLVQENIPNLQYAVDILNKRVSVLRIPSPTHQEYINKTTPAEEFKGFLRSLMNNERKEKCLIINLQDRTAWKEHSRASVLEELQKNPLFSEQLIIVTLPKDTEFYYQEASYKKINQASTFINHFRAHLMDESCGFYFPEQIREKLFSEDIDRILHGVHQLFFGGRNVLPLERRLDFIEIVYLFIELRLLEIIQPDDFSLVCKDGIDCGSCGSALLFIFLKWMKCENLSPKDMERLNVLLYAPAILIRERVISSDRLMRMIGALKEIELVMKHDGWENFVKKVHETFGPLNCVIA